ncbi:MAG: hypothetical protein CMJ64_08095 [Planctomycetaceae bacterium]|nr:hypothetical protein [Planctomycetaceae bacterium]
MAEITLNDEQAKILAHSGEVVIVRDPRGNVIGHLAPNKARDEAAIVAEAKQRLASNQPRYSTAEVLDHLSSLESE